MARGGAENDYSADAVLYGKLAEAPRRKNPKIAPGLRLGKVQVACLALFNEAENLGGPECPDDEVPSGAFRNHLQEQGFGTTSVNKALESLERHQLIESVRYPEHYSFTFSLTDTGKEALAEING